MSQLVFFQSKETLIYSASGTKDKAHGAQKARHIMQIGELLSTAQRRISPAQPMNQCFPNAQNTIKHSQTFNRATLQE